MLTMNDVQQTVDASYERFKTLDEGCNADYIPVLAQADPHLFGIAAVTADGSVHAAGDVKTEVSIQSISKVFTMSQVVQEQGLEAIEKRIGVDATGARFNSIMVVEAIRAIIGPGAPEINPLVNPGAIAGLYDDSGKWLYRTGLPAKSGAIRSDFTYQSRDAMGTQRPAQTLKLRGGTCRDFSLLMMEALRGTGMATRFVSGYLSDKTLDTPTPPMARNTGLQQGARQVESRDDPGVLGGGATHAWLHVFLPGAGWVPCDPTNTLVGGTDLIRVAFSRKPEQAAPVSGSWFGAAADFAGLDVSVSVRRVDAVAEPVVVG